MTTTATATRPSRAEINRRNAQKSTGPRSPEGKARSKFNAVKHGMTAQTLVLPGEDPQKLRIRFETLTDQLQPQNEVEQILLEEAVHSSWMLERARRAELARLSHLIESVPIAEARREHEEAVALGLWLFNGRGKDAEAGLQDNVLNVLGTAPATAKGPGHLDLLDHPQAIVFRLESTAAGCRWLLDRWNELRALLEAGHLWEHGQQVNAVRLLGKRPLDSTSCHDVVDPFQWCAHITLPDDLELTPRDRWDRWLLRQLDGRLPAGEAETMAAFREIAEREIARLVAIAEGHRRRAEADDPAARLSFDDSAEGERLRRYQFSCGRSLFRSVETILKVRRSGVATDCGKPSTAEPAESTETPTDPDPVTPTADREDSQNEPSDPNVDFRSPQREPREHGDELRPGIIKPAEAGTPTGDPVGSGLDVSLQAVSQERFDGPAEAGTPTADFDQPAGCQSLFRKGERGASAPCLRGPSPTGQGADAPRSPEPDPSGTESQPSGGSTKGSTDPILTDAPVDCESPPHDPAAPLAADIAPFQPAALPIAIVALALVLAVLAGAGAVARGHGNTQNEPNPRHDSRPDPQDTVTVVIRPGELEPAAVRNHGLTTVVFTESVKEQGKWRRAREKGPECEQVHPFGLRSSLVTCHPPPVEQSEPLFSRALPVYNPCEEWGLL